ncbi:hypothetical protein IW967_02875 [Alicyclobacillus mali]|uniref:Prepilin peptidase CpaA n=1 Tax=Alicyclobacillus mali (ex Roth et al. 2021) TaxID=1123961 RepID=A0ABS0F0M1_9BACL|nr:hypothetical protein [Alicyclobacillus mali (ex Roth et al. 2021)]MBF8376816.1 hypothetical protein [Alicyclobacillus mali (ex Roth et al. 2021)]
MRTELVLLEFNACAMTLLLAFCAVTDILYRRVSETGLIAFTVFMLIADAAWLHAAWWLLLSMCLFGIGLGALWWCVDHGHALGDAEMVGLMGVGLGLLALVPLLIGLVAALVSRPLWPVLAGPHVPTEERNLAPLGVYFFFGAALTTTLFLVVVRP